MTEKDLAKALLDLGVGETSSEEVKEQTQRILKRDRRWITLLSVTATFCWLVSLAALYWLVISLIGAHQEMELAGGPDADPVIKAIYEFLIILASSVEALIFALLSTFVLLFFSRRATLRQINANLLGLSQQIKQSVR